MSSSAALRTILLAGASRGLGLGLAAEFLGRGWSVIATARKPEQSAGLQALQKSHPGQITIEAFDIAAENAAKALAAKISGRSIDVLFVVAGISAHRDTPIQDVPPEDVAREFITNATAPIALAEAVLPAMAPHGTIAFMTSILGSIGSNAGGGMDLYRASKSALNMLAACFALRQKSYPVLLFHPGWVRTEMGGANAPLDVETSARGLADQIGRHTKPGLAYLDYQGQKLPW